MRISDWSSDVCASDLERPPLRDLLSALSGLHDRVAAQTMDAASHGEEIYDHARLLMGLAGALALLVVIGAVAMVMLLVSRRLRRLEARMATLAENRSDEHTSELQSQMPISYAVICLKKK